jgi:ribokinase
VEQAAAFLLNKGAGRVIITLGSQGTYLADPSYREILPAFHVKAVDTTAAGDVFCGAFGVAIGEGRDLLQAARFASAASAISVTRLGAQTSVPSRVEIEQFLASHE